MLMLTQRPGAALTLWRIVLRPDWSLPRRHRHLSTLPTPVIYEDDQHSIRDSSIPTPVWDCLHQLRVAGHEVFLVGGAVRDLLLQDQQEPKDLDLLTSAQLQKVKELFQHHNPRIIGRNFPICRLEVKGYKVEVSSMHTRPAVKPWSAAAAAVGVPADVAEHLLGSCTAPGRGRRSSIVPHTAQHQQPLSWAAARRANAAARDFTVNALLYDPFQRIVYDYVGGVSHIRAKVLRCIGDARTRFQADPACLLRAVRCAARAGLQLESSTRSALQAQAHLVTSLNPHRLTAELTAMLAHGAAAPSLLLLQQTQLMQHILPSHQQYWQRMQHQQEAGDIARSGNSLPGKDKHKKQSWVDTASAAAGGTTARRDPADSALGQMLNSMTMQQQHQQQQSVLQAVASTSYHDRQTNPMQYVLDQQHNLLLRVAAALDRHVSVRQPATAEVVLACLTAPLLLEAMQDAVTQVQQHLQQPQQHRTQDHDHQQQQQQEQYPLPVVDGILDEAVQLGALVGDSNSSSCIESHNSSGNSHDLWQVQSIERAVLQQQQLALATAAAARAYSTDSSSSTASSFHSSGGTAAAAAGGLGRLGQQLLLGSDFEDVLHEQAVALALQVCGMSRAEDGAQPSSVSNQLFGIHTPRLAAALLTKHTAVCKQLRLLAEAHIHGAKGRLHVKQQQVSTASSQQERQVVGSRLQNSHKHSGSVKFFSSSSQAFLQQECLHSDYEHAYPRTNKQYRRLMEQQKQAAAQQRYQAGHLEAIPSPKAMLTAAAEAVLRAGDDAYCYTRGRQAIRHEHRQHAAVIAGVALNQREFLVHQVLASAAAGFDVLEAVGSQLGRDGGYV